MRRFATCDLHQWTRWVLLAWLCVLAGSVLSPLARAQAGKGLSAGMEPVCTAMGSTHWVSSPVAGLLETGLPTPAHGGLDCPWCMPVLAPPPPQRLAMAAQPLPRSVVQAAPQTPQVHTAAAPMPARGPPQVHSFLL